MKAEILFPKYSSPSGTAEVGGGGRRPSATLGLRAERPPERDRTAPWRRRGGREERAAPHVAACPRRWGRRALPPRGAVPQSPRARAQPPAGPRGPPQCSCAGRAYVCMRVCACAWCVRVRTPPPGPRAPVCSAPQSLAPAPFPPRPRLAAARVSRSSRSDGKFAQQPRGRAGLSTRAAERERRGEEGEASDSRATAAAAPTRRSLPGHGLGWRPGDPRPPACPSCPLCAGQTVALALRLRFCPALARLLLFIRLGK